MDRIAFADYRHRDILPQQYCIHSLRASNRKMETQIHGCQPPARETALFAAGHVQISPSISSHCAV